jgi:ATPase family associated with various cellular activities (AAA)
MAAATTDFTTEHLRLSATRSKSDGTGRDDHLERLRRLDIVLERAVAHARVMFGDEQEGAFRGLFISEGEIDGLIGQTDRFTLASHTDVSDAVEEFLVAAVIKDVGSHWGLSNFDYGVLLLALAPELDLRYERIYAYLQDDVTKRRPTVDLALNLLCTDWTARLAERQRFGPDAPLLKSGLLRVAATDATAGPPLLARSLRLDDRVARALIGDDALDSQLTAYCQRIQASIDVLRPDDQSETARHLVRYATMSAQESARPLRLMFSGPVTSAKREAAAGFANGLGQSLLIANLDKSSEWRADPRTVAMVLLREATLSNAILYLDGLPESVTDKQATTALLRGLAFHPGIVIIAADLTATQDFADEHQVLRVPFQLPDYEARRTLWQRLTEPIGIRSSANTMNKLSSTFQLAPEQIEAAVATARQRLNWRVSRGDGIEEAEWAQELCAAARGQGGEELAALTSKVAPVYRWNDIVLPEDPIEQLHELCIRARFRHAVLERGGFGRKLSSGKGITALFAGPSGAGKSMAAEVVANELGLDLFRVDLSRVVSKYIGETEQNLERIFTAAVRSNGVLLFDEADALMGKRSQVHDAHDRYANLEISYLLQKMEQHEGITILTTNLKANIDDAFKRRLTYTVQFPLPDEAARATIWQRVWPAETLLDPDVDVLALAARFKLTGGNISNIGLSSAYLAAAGGHPVRMADILRATRREYAKVGRILAPAELEAPVC